MKWKPIKTAPKDGGLVLLCNGVTQHVNVGFYSPEPTLSNCGPWRWGLTIKPTHWIPIPKLP